MNFEALCKTVLIIILCACSNPLLSAIKLVAENGQPAAGFPDEFVYFSLSTPVIGSSGHVAFSGQATNNTDTFFAVWSGLPGNLKPVIKSNDSLIGFPSNVLFQGLSLTGNKPVVTQSGNVGLMVSLSGPVNALNPLNTGVVAVANGGVHGVLRTGIQAPGFPAGHTIFTIANFAFTDAGMIISGTVQNPNIRDSLEGALWFWDFSSLKKISSPINDCHFFSLSGSPLSINKMGDMVFATAILGDLCPIEKFALFRSDGQNTEIILADDDPVPNMLNTNFDLSITTSFSLPGISNLTINDQGEILFFAQLQDGRAIKNSLWIMDSAGNPKLLMLKGEFVPGRESMLLDPAILTTASVINNEVSVIAQMRFDASGETLIGQPRSSQPYSSLNEAGVSQLSSIAELNDEPPPGFGETWFFRSFSSLFLNDNNQFFVGGAAADASNSFGSFNKPTNAVWRGTTGEIDLERVLYDGMPLIINGEEKQLDFFILGGANSLVGDSNSTVGGHPSMLDNNNQLIFSASVSSDNNIGNSGIFLLTDQFDMSADRIFTLAEQKLDTFFAPANVASQTAGGFVFRFYPTTNTYLGINGGEVFVLGGPFGANVSNVGTVSSVLEFLENLIIN